MAAPWTSTPEQRLRLFAEHATDYAVVVIDPEGRIIEWSAGARHLTGWGAEEAVGRPFALIFTPEDRAAGIPEAEMDTARREGKAPDVRWHIRKDGSRFFVDGVLNAIPGPDGAIAGFGKVLRDITERKRIEEALDEASRRKDEFLAMLAHELRNPIAAIAGALTLLERTAMGPDEEWAKEVVARQTKNLARMIDDLLDASRVGQGKLLLKKELLDVSAIVGRCAESANRLIQERGHELDVSIVGGRLWVEADPTRLEQVLVNLLVNAAKYTPEGGRIWLSAERDRGDVVVRVRDTGVGIPAEALPGVFDLFMQVEGTTQRCEGGLGVGLTLVRKLVELHGGSVEAASEGPGEGSTFTVRLPAAYGAEDSPSRRDSARCRRLARPLRILVVDDDRDAAGGVSRLLSSLGHELRTAHDGPSALEAAEAFRPDAVLLDIGLPGMDGCQVARRLRDAEWGRECLLVAVSGYGQERDRARSLEAGMDRHLTKPVDFDELVALL